MKLPVEIRDVIIVFSVTEDTLLDIWFHFRDVKWTLYVQEFPWGIINKCLPEEFLSEFRDYIDFRHLRSYDLSEEFIIANADRIPLHCVFLTKEVSEKTIRMLVENFDINDWYWLVKRQNLSEDFILEFQDHIEIRNLDYTKSFSIGFLEKIYDILIHDISDYSDEDLSDNFISVFQDDIDFYELSRVKVLSESFIRQYLTHFDDRTWTVISESQKLSQDFIREFKDFLDWDMVVRNQQVSVEFVDDPWK
jgi:hypothetical protein